MNDCVFFDIEQNESAAAPIDAEEGDQADAVFNPFGSGPVPIRRRAQGESER